MVSLKYLYCGTCLMYLAAKHMFRSSPDNFSGRKKEYCVSFRVPKWIHFTIPGNACGLDPEHYSSENPNEGYELQPHNVDSSFQQLCFLMGLAKLHELAER